MQLPRVALLPLLLLTCTAAPVFAQAAPPTSVYADATVLRWTHPAPEDVASWVAVVSGVRLPLAGWTRAGPDSFEAVVGLTAPLSVTLIAVGLDGLESVPSNRLVYWGAPPCRSDLNDNGSVDLPDLSAVLWQLGDTCP